MKAVVPRESLNLEKCVVDEFAKDHLQFCVRNDDRYGGKVLSTPNVSIRFGTYSNNSRLTVQTEMNSKIQQYLALCSPRQNGLSRTEPSTEAAVHTLCSIHRSSHLGSH